MNLSLPSFPTVGAERNGIAGNVVKAPSMVHWRIGGGLRLRSQLHVLLSESCVIRFHRSYFTVNEPNLRPNLILGGTAIDQAIKMIEIFPDTAHIITGVDLTRHKISDRASEK
jgi:hypothetical protein